MGTCHRPDAALETGLEQVVGDLKLGLEPGKPCSGAARTVLFPCRLVLGFGLGDSSEDLELQQTRSSPQRSNLGSLASLLGMGVNHKLRRDMYRLHASGSFD